MIRVLPGTGLGAVELTVLYAVLEGFSTSVPLGLLVLLRGRERRAFAHILRSRLRPAAFTGVGIFLTYLLVLVAMAFVTNVSYVVAFRQISIPIGVGLGVLIFKEARHAPKFVGTAVIFIGLILVGTG